MPIYEYECTVCGKRHEVIQKFSDPVLTECPACKGKLRKLISNSSFVLKGTGWYVTDYARKDGGNDNGKAKKKHPANGNGSSSGTGSKPEKTSGAEPSGTKPPSA